MSARHPAWKTKDLPSATTEEVAWAEERIASGYTNDFIARGIKNADTEDDALRFLKYHHSMSGGVGSNGAPGDVHYWYELEGGPEIGHFWFGPYPNDVGGGDEAFIPGSRYVAIRYRDVVRKVRTEETSPGLF